MKLFFRQKGFSFLSLLTSCAIICILMTMISLSVIFMRKSVDRFRCQMNLKQIYEYWIMYLDHNHDQSEPFDDLDHQEGQSLKSILEKFLSEKRGHSVDLSSLFICPADKEHTPQQLKKNGSYDYREEMLSREKKFIFSNIADPQEKILMGDYRSGWHDYSLGNWYDKLGNPSKTINVLFCDGHVECIDEEEWEENLSRPF